MLVICVTLNLDGNGDLVRKAHKQPLTSVLFIFVVEYSTFPEALGAQGRALLTPALINSRLIQFNKSPTTALMANIMQEKVISSWVTLQDLLPVPFLKGPSTQSYFWAMCGFHGNIGKWWFGMEVQPHAGGLTPLCSPPESCTAG